MRIEVSYRTSSAAQDKMIALVLESLGFRNSQSSEHNHDAYPCYVVDVAKKTYHWARRGIGATNCDTLTDLLLAVTNIGSRFVVLNDEYTAELDGDVVKVGCQNIPTSKVLELAKLING